MRVVKKQKVTVSNATFAELHSYLAGASVYRFTADQAAMIALRSVGVVPEFGIEYVFEVDGSMVGISYTISNEPY